ncbi:Peptidoglycan/xylan/chitin deacetylase [Pseudomonas syringae pv. actinidiae]|uniref:Peptidoglycan/xylan/chitin deacetylase n=1 Tax=Pseudomonas syringae pv. actinidiae TaxID=103796 RepID=A0AAN4TLJ1_PSESF|nr:Peptidoglycan/xylan/chitin deacetylase [Pseudomonas syringae pv. actinidiae]
MEALFSLPLRPEPATISPLHETNSLPLAHPYGFLSALGCRLARLHARPTGVISCFHYRSFLIDLPIPRTDQPSFRTPLIGVTY